MRGVFGMLLIGGGVILVYGLFTGKITFPTSGTPGIGNPLTGIVQTVVPSTKNTTVDANGNCPSGFKKTFDSSGLPYCVPG
jgi:hypothetical protein